MTERKSELHRRWATVRSGQLDLKVKLTCECVITLRIEPYRNMKLACPNGLGHGYQLRWVSVTYLNGFVSYNKGFGS